MENVTTNSSGTNKLEPTSVMVVVDDLPSTSIPLHRLLDNSKEIPADVVTTADNTTTNGVLDQVPAGTYTVVITNSASGCTSTQTFTVENNFSTTDPAITIGSVSIRIYLCGLMT